VDLGKEGRVNSVANHHEQIVGAIMRVAILSLLGVELKSAKTLGGNKNSNSDMNFMAKDA
jgi:hypothetical protein